MPPKPLRVDLSKHMIFTDSLAKNEKWTSMRDVMRVDNAKAARDIAIEAAKFMWRYTIPSSFYEIEYDKSDKCWRVEASYSDEKLSFKIDAITGNVSPFKTEKISDEK